jgi:hypothetical protein
MTKDSVDSPIKPVGRRALAYWFVIVNVDAVPHQSIFPDSYNAKAIAYAKANAKVIVITHGIPRILFTPSVIDESVKLVKLFAQDRIVSKVNFSQLIADLEAFKQIIPDDKAAKKERQEFADQFLKMWSTAFNLTPELLNLSINEISEIDRHYFYINRRILECQKVAVNISPTVWQEIEERMLRVP